MSEPQVETYDFRRTHQLADDVEQMLTTWQRATVKLMSKKLYDCFQVNYEWEPGKLRSTSIDDVEQMHETSTLVIEHRIGDANVGWITVPRQFMLLLFELMFGQATEEAPEDRELTDIEETLFSSVGIQLCAAMFEAQPTPNRLNCDVVGARRIDELGQTFSDSDQVVVADINLLAPFEGQAIHWVLSQAAVLQYVTNVSEFKAAETRGRPELERLVHQIPIDVVIRLGETQVRWDQLSKLAVGDIIMLDQRVSEPLHAEIGDQTVFLGFPGKHGNRQAFRITDHFDPESNQY